MNKKLDNINGYKYKPFLFFVLTYIFTWLNWFVSAYFSRTSDSETLYTIFMALGLFAPATVALVLILKSKNKQLKKDYIDKVVNLKRIQPSTIAAMVLIMPFAILVSILLSTLCGQSMEQLSLADGFSFSVGTVPSLIVLLVAAVFEEFGWRGYAMDSLGSKYNLFISTWIFAVIWAFWHVPLFLIEDSYQYNILQQSIWYAVNFIISSIPLAFILNWLCAKNRGSILAAIIFHFFVNIMQEAINMTQVSKCIETGVMAAIAIIVVIRNMELFFDKTASMNTIPYAN